MKQIKILFFVLLIILLSFLVNIFDSNFYNENFKENGAYETFGEEAYSVNTEVFKYFSFRGELNTNFFNDKEKEHLKDVRRLFIGGYILLLISLFSLSFVKKKELNSIFLKSGLVGVAFILLVFILSYFGFNALFTGFHEVFFEEGTWLFNPDENITKLYTFDLFYELFLRILLTSIFLFFLLIIIYMVKVKYQK